jgi:hypothetical protein
MTYHEERAVHVHDVPRTITISQRSKIAWVAVGDYMGKRVEVVGSSAANAARRWVAAACCKSEEIKRARRLAVPDSDVPNV